MKLDLSAPIQRPGRWVAAAVAAALPLRLLYLARFNWDPRWMNANYLKNARSLLVGTPQLHGPPMPELLVLLQRALGCDGVTAIHGVYLIGSIAFSAGLLLLALAIWPALPRARAGALVVLSAALPALSGDDGFDNVGVLLGAGLFVLAFALALTAAARERPGAPLLAAVAATAAAASSSRSEALLGVAALALLLALFGRRVEGLAAPRRSSLALFAGMLAGMSITLSVRLLSTRDVALAGSTYAFYTFYGGLPRSMCATPCIGEYGPYLESVARFGSFADNHGSLAVALARHPAAAFVRLGHQLAAWLLRLLDPKGVGPALPFAAAGALLAFRARRSGLPLRRGTLLLGYVAPAAVLYLPPAITEYFLPVLPVVLLAAALGAGALVARLPVAAALPLGALALAAGALFPATSLGHWGPSTPRVIRLAAPYLEERCRTGCLANYPPQHLTAEVWVDLEAGAPLPPHHPHDEMFVANRPTPALRDACSFRGRIARARAAGFRGPVLFIDVKSRAMTFSDLGFDREHEWEGPPDLASATLERSFTDGEDRLDIWSIP